MAWRVPFSACLLLLCAIFIRASNQIVTCAAGANCTAILQSAIDAGGDLTVSGAFVVLPIFLRRSHQTITFAAGSTVIAQPGAFKGPGDCLFYMDGIENVTILGYGASWAMHRSDYNNSAKYQHSEWRHALSILSSTQIRVLGLHISETGGDGVYLLNNIDVQVRDVTTDGAYRNGLSLISGTNIMISGCHFLRTAGTAPEAGIDIEPNTVKPGRAPEKLQNITFEDIECRQNLGCGLSFSLSKLAMAYSPSISVNGLVIEGAAGMGFSPEQLAYNIGVLVSGKKDINTSSPGTLLLTNVSVTNTYQPGLEVYGKLATGAATILRDVRLEDVALGEAVRWGGENVPILFHQSHPSSIGGLVFDACAVTDAKARPFLRCDSCNSRGNATNITGSIVVTNPSGCPTDLGRFPQDVSLDVDCNKAQVQPTPGRLRMIVPMYMEPGRDWQRLAQSARDNPSVEITAIISPQHWANDATMAGDNIYAIAHNKTWLDGMDELRTAGVLIQHYYHQRNLTCIQRVAKGCATAPDCCLVPSGAIENKHRCCNSFANISDIVDAALQFFPHDGFFNDNGPNNVPSADSNYSTLDSIHDLEKRIHARTQTGATSPRPFTFNGDHLDSFDPWAMSTFPNATMLYESPGPPACEGLPFSECFKPIPSGVRSLYPSTRFAALAVDVRNSSEMRKWVDGFIAAGYGTLCLLGEAEREYTELPTFWEEEVAYLASKSKNVSSSSPAITFRTPYLVGRSNTTFFWIPNTQGGILPVADRGLIITADIDGDGIPPTNCSAVRCPHTVFFSELRPSARSNRDVAHIAPSSDYGPWVDLNTTVPHHRVVFDFANGTHRGFDSEILCAQYSTMCTKAALQYTDWTYSGDNLIEIRGQGKALFDIPADVNLSMMYKTTGSKVMRLQVGSARLADGTTFVVAEGTRVNPLPVGGPDSSFLLSSLDSGLSWSFRHVFDRQEGMPASIHKNKSYPQGPSEPNIALLPDGKTLVIIARMKNGAHLWQTISRDRGATWTPMAETAAWAVYPQLTTLKNGAVLLASGRPGIGMWVLDQATMTWGSFHNLAAAHNHGLPSNAYPASYAAISSANASVDFYHPLSKAYLGMYELGCEGRSCSVIFMYDMLGNGDQPPPGPAGEYDQSFTMEAVVTA